MSREVGTAGPFPELGLGAVPCGLHLGLTPALLLETAVALLRENVALQQGSPTLRFHKLDSLPPALLKGRPARVPTVPRLQLGLARVVGVGRSRLFPLRQIRVPLDVACVQVSRWSRRGGQSLLLPPCSPPYFPAFWPQLVFLSALASFLLPHPSCTFPAVKPPAVPLTPRVLPRASCSVCYSR